VNAVSSKSEKVLKQLALTVLPQRLLYWLWHLRRRGKPRTEDGTATDCRVIPVQDGVHLDVYWTDVDLGPGPGASLYVLDEEVLRLDCFGGKTGHMHVNPIQVNLALDWNVTPRFFFPPDSVDKHIERGAFEVAMNVPAMLQTNQLARIREFPIERKRLAVAAGEMRVYMGELLVKHCTAIETKQGDRR
jgi:hypothetical protein